MCHLGPIDVIKIIIIHYYKSIKAEFEVIIMIEKI